MTKKEFLLKYGLAIFAGMVIAGTLIISQTPPFKKGKHKYEYKWECDEYICVYHSHSTCYNQEGGYYEECELDLYGKYNRTTHNNKTTHSCTVRLPTYDFEKSVRGGNFDLICIDGKGYRKLKGEG